MSTVHQSQFHRDSWARWYAKQHLKTDPGITSVYYLPNGADEREIRLVEINTLMGERLDGSLEAIDFGIDRGESTEHRLVVLDVSANQWKKILQGDIPLPQGWSRENCQEFSPDSGSDQVDDDE